MRLITRLLFCAFFSSFTSSFTSFFISMNTSSASEDFLTPVVEDAQYALDYVDQKFSQIVDLSKCTYDFGYQGSDVCRFIRLGLESDNKQQRNDEFNRLCSEMNEEIRDKRDRMSTQLATEINTKIKYRAQLYQESKGLIAQYLNVQDITVEDIKDICPDSEIENVSAELKKQIFDYRYQSMSKLIVGSSSNSTAQFGLDMSFKSFYQNLGGGYKEDDREVLAAFYRKMLEKGDGIIDYCKEVITPPITFYESLPFTSVSCKFENESICTNFIDVLAREVERKENDSAYSKTVREKVEPMFREAKQKMLQKVDAMCLLPEIKSKMKAQLQKFMLYDGKLDSTSSIQGSEIGSGCFNSACCSHKHDLIYFSPQYVAEVENGDVSRVRSTLYHELGHATDLLFKTFYRDFSMYQSGCDLQENTIERCLLQKYSISEDYDKQRTVESEAFADEMKMELLADDFANGVVSKYEIIKDACVSYMSSDPSFDSGTTHPHAIDRASAILLHPRIQSSFSCKKKARSRSCIQSR